GLRMASCLALAAATFCGVMGWRTRTAHASGSAPHSAPLDAAGNRATGYAANSAGNGAGDTGNADRAIYSQETAAHYNYRFGGDTPFLPSNATSDTGEVIDSRNFLSAKYCGHCHQEAYAQWRQTAHANSFRNPFYVKNVNLLIKGKGIEFT